MRKTTSGAWIQVNIVPEIGLAIQPDIPHHQGVFFAMKHDTRVEALLTETKRDTTSLHKEKKRNVDLIFGPGLSTREWPLPAKFEHRMARTRHKLMRPNKGKDEQRNECKVIVLLTTQRKCGTEMRGCHMEKKET